RWGWPFTTGRRSPYRFAHAPRSRSLKGRGMNRRKAHNNLLRRDWIAQARAFRIEDEIARRRIKLNGRCPECCGPGPKCGGPDRSAIKTSKQVWNCRGCQRGGDVISLIQRVDGCTFDAAVATLSRQDPTGCGNAPDLPNRVLKSHRRSCCK